LPTRIDRAAALPSPSGPARRAPFQGRAMNPSGTQRSRKLTLRRAGPETGIETPAEPRRAARQTGHFGINAAPAVERREGKKVPAMARRRSGMARSFIAGCTECFYYSL